MKKLNINNKKVQDRLERLMRLLGQIENLKDFMEGEFSTAVEEAELKQLVKFANNCIEIIEAYTQKDIKTVLKSKSAYIYRDLNLSVLEEKEEIVLEEKAIIAETTGLEVVAYRLENKQFISVSIEGEYFSSFNMEEELSLTVARTISEVYSKMSTIDIKNVILSACNAECEAHAKSQTIGTIEQGIIDDLNNDIAFIMEERGFLTVSEVATRLGYNYVLITPISSIMGDYKRVQFLKDGNMEEDRKAKRQQLYGHKWADTKTTESLVVECTESRLLAGLKINDFQYEAIKETLIEQNYRYIIRTMTGIVPVWSETELKDILPLHEVLGLAEVELIVPCIPEALGDDSKTF